MSAVSTEHNHYIINIPVRIPNTHSLSLSINFANGVSMFSLMTTHDEEEGKVSFHFIKLDILLPQKNGISAHKQTEQATYPHIHVWVDLRTTNTYYWVIEFAEVSPQGHYSLQPPRPSRSKVRSKEDQAKQ